MRVRIRRCIFELFNLFVDMSHESRITVINCLYCCNEFSRASLLIHVKKNDDGAAVLLRYSTSGTCMI